MDELIHWLNPLKGWPDEYRLDMVGELTTTLRDGIRPFPAGRCVHISSLASLAAMPGGNKGGQLPLFSSGVANSEMPLFTFTASNAPDASNIAPAGYDWYAIAPAPSGRPRIGALVATGAFELESTEFDTTRTYVANDPLMGVADDTDDTPLIGGGCLTNNTAIYTDTVVGLISRGKYTNANGINSIAFWPVFIPKSAGS